MCWNVKKRSAYCCRSCRPKWAIWPGLPSYKMLHAAMAIQHCASASQLHPTANRTEALSIAAGRDAGAWMHRAGLLSDHQNNRKSANTTPNQPKTPPTNHRPTGGGGGTIVPTYLYIADQRRRRRLYVREKRLSASKNTVLRHRCPSNK